MLTQIEIDGFKTFKDFKVELAPFQVIVGPNGSGKSNLFDAMQLLSRLAEVDDLGLAFQAHDNDPGKVRGDAHELFTILPGGQRTNRIRMAVEMLVDRKIRDSFGKEAELKYTRLRYEIEITLQKNNDKFGSELLKVTHEALKYISPEQDNWCQKYGLSSQNGWLPEFAGSRTSFISTFVARPPRETVIEPLTICLCADGDGEEREFLADRVLRTILSAINYTNYPHVFAARNEMLNWRFLHLNHEALHQPSPVNASLSLLKDGSNLPTMIARIQSSDEFTLTDISRDMANLVPGILKIRVEKNSASNEYSIWAETTDRQSLSAQVLSDGTLRLLALAAIRNFPRFYTVLCLEEPENGVHPLHLENMARLLREMATDFNDTRQVDEPLRQVLITTHSPLFISQPSVLDCLLLAFTPTRAGVQGSSSMKVTRMEPVITPNTQTQLRAKNDRDRAVEVYTIDTVMNYLNSNYLTKADEQLKKARTTL